MTGQNKTTPLLLLSLLYEECLKKNGSFPNDSNYAFPGSQQQGEVTSTSRSPSKDDTDFGAVMYIIAVLVFYSAGIMVMIVKYLKTEKREMEEEAMLDNFFKGFPTHRTAQEDHVNKVAIQAFHTLTSVYNDSNGVQTGVSGLGVAVRQPRRLLITDV